MTDLVCKPATSPSPVFIDGLTTQRSYVILAVRLGEQYNCICLRNNGTLKFYPSYEFWGTTPTQLRELGLTQLYDREHYQGNHSTTTEEVRSVLNVVRNLRGATVVPEELIAGVFETPMSERQRCHVLHPSSSGRSVSLKALPQQSDLPALEAKVELPLLPFNG
jgi:hypothetical protein